MCDRGLTALPLFDKFVHCIHHPLLTLTYLIRMQALQDRLPSDMVKHPGALQRKQARGVWL